MVVFHDSLQSVSEMLHAAAMAVFYKRLISPSSQELFRYLRSPLPHVSQMIRQTRRHTTRPNYLNIDTPRTDYLKNSLMRRCISIKNDLPRDVISKSFSVDSQEKVEESSKTLFRSDIKYLCKQGI